MELVRNKKIRVLTLCSIIILSFGIFFSKTIYTYNLSTVTATIPKKGVLNKQERANGLVSWKNTVNIQAKVGGKVEEVFVEPGDKVKKGDPLLSMTYDEEATAKKRTKIEADQRKLLNQIANAKQRLVKAKKQLEEANNKMAGNDQAQRYDLEQLQISLENAKKDLELKKQLLTVGGIPAQDVTKAEMEVKKIQSQLTNKRVSLQEQNSQGLTTAQFDIESIERELVNLDLDLKAYKQDEAEHDKLMKDQEENRVLTATEDMTIMSLSIEEGQQINKDQLLLKYGQGNLFIVKANMNVKNNFIAVDDTCTLTNAALRIKGKITKVLVKDNQKEISISFDSDKVVEGDSFQINFEKKGQQSYTLVPNGALQKDQNGYFLYTIKQNQGILGDEYIVKKLRVSIGDSDDDNTVILKGITLFEPTVLVSDKAIKENDRIKIKNEDDFYGK